MKALTVTTLSFLAELKMVGDEPPSECRLFAMGSNQTSKGVFLFTQKSVQACDEAYKKLGRDLPFDYGHAMNLPAWATQDPAQAGKAAGWFKLEMRGDGPWAADIRWTPAAAKMLRDREYRFFSPTVSHTEDGEVMEIRNCALTNEPATYNQKPLMLASDPLNPAVLPEKNPMKNLIAVSLAMAVDVPDEAVILRVQKLASTERDLLSELDVKSVDEAFGKLKGLKAVALNAAALETQLAEVKTKQLTADIATVIAAAERDGKVVPAQVSQLTAMGTASLDGLKAFLAVAPRVVPVSKTEPAPGAGGDISGLSSEDLAIAKMMKVDPKKIAEQRAAGVTTITSTVKKPGNATA